MGLNEIIKTNRERLRAIEAYYDPITGQGSTSVPRTLVKFHDFPVEELWLPDDFIETGFCQKMIELGLRGYLQFILNTGYSMDMANLLYIEFCKERFKYDFEFWAYMCAKIAPKGGGADISFCLNRAQRYYLGKLEELRRANKPIDIILLKARQWGGSTLTQIYMLWIQLVHRQNWNSVICGDVESQSKIVTGMLNKVLESYPIWATGGVKVTSNPYEGSAKTRKIDYCQCMYSVGSAQKPESLRSQNISMSHLTEVGLWKDTAGKTPEDLVQSIFGSILDGPYTVKVLESTAKGVGNYFHRTWINAERGLNNFHPVFIPWFMIDIYSEYIPQVEYGEFWKSMNEYERWLFDLGATFEAIKWYRNKKKSMSDDWRMCSEYPSTPQEAFQSTGRRYFPIKYVEMARKTCCDACFYGEFVGEDIKGAKALENVHFEDAPVKLHKQDNVLWVWAKPDTGEEWDDRYVVSVDIGGAGDQADYSVIKVFDKLPMTEVGGVPEVVAEWHGHIEHDLLIWKAAQIATAYGNALLVVESNTLETEGTEGDNFEYVLDEIVEYYDNLYCRTSAEQIRKGAPVRFGFHTNTKTKPMVLNHLKAAMRDGLYIERCLEATYEMDNFEIKADGKQTGAVEGCHDDRVMSTAIGVYVCYQSPIPTKKERNNPSRKRTRIVSEASM